MRVRSILASSVVSVISEEKLDGGSHVCLVETLRNLIVAK